MTKSFGYRAHVTVVDRSVSNYHDHVIVEKLIQMIKKAVEKDGFNYLTRYGTPFNDPHRRFSIAQCLCHVISEDKNNRLICGITVGSPCRSEWLLPDEYLQESMPRHDGPVIDGNLRRTLCSTGWTPRDATRARAWRARTYVVGRPHGPRNDDHYAI